MMDTTPETLQSRTGPAGAAGLFGWMVVSAAVHAGLLTMAAAGLGTGEALTPPLVESIAVEIFTELPQPGRVTAVEPAAPEPALQPEPIPFVEAEPVDDDAPAQAPPPEAVADPAEPAPAPVAPAAADSPGTPANDATAPRPAVRTAAVDARRAAFAKAREAANEAADRPAGGSPEGLWETGTKDSRYRLELCGKDGTRLCGWLVYSQDRSPEAQALVNQMILDHARRVGPLTWEGSLQISGQSASGTMTLATNDRLEVSACVLFVICGEFVLYRRN
jgi:hypothetical protein